MAEYQVTSWRDLPSLVVARGGEQTSKVPLPARFQEAIDEAAMRLGDSDSEAYLAGWSRSEWTPAEGEPAEVAAAVARELDETWDDGRVRRYLDSL